MSGHSGGSFWLDAVLYDLAPPKPDALLYGATYQEDPLLANPPDEMPSRADSLSGWVGT